ncbi:hypothetical protein TCON_0011 [Astathelohania contejeani]|uniref:Uncharacterized protein n=1 Tax=Astathelohania contejeani TaxID=164912 RepID=A0ABQ7I301_9MICR|nr:hypothetical protein TCON_0011 [Thelohania contejeani]
MNESSISCINCRFKKENFKSINTLENLSDIQSRILSRWSLMNTPSTPLKVNSVPSFKKSEIEYYEYSKAYFKFLQIIDVTNQKTCIKTISLPIFSIIFSSTYYDDRIEDFLENFINDPLFYEKNERIKVYILLLMAYFYTSKLKKDGLMNRLYDKIIKNLYIFEGSLLNDVINFTFTPLGNINIDKILLCIPFKTNESLFLNYYYIKYLGRRNDDILENFLNRIFWNLSKIENNYIIYFLKNVFLYNTVIYKIIENKNVFRMMYSFFRKSISKIDTVKYTDKISNIMISITILLLEKCSKDSEIYELIIKESHFLTNYKKGLELKIRGVKSIDEIKNLINSNDGNNLKQIYKFLFGLLSIIDDEKSNDKADDILSLLIFMFDRPMPEFTVNFFSQFIKLFGVAIEKIDPNEKEKALKINKKYWNELSRIILIIQRYGMRSVENVKKKKQINLKLNPIIKGCTGLVMKIKKLESNFDSKDGCLKLKDRLFMIVEEENV